MNKATLPILSRLRSLQTASRFAPGGGRILADATDPNPLAQLLRATNETMLGRSLQFDCSSGASLTLDVSGRRILRLTAAIGLDGAESCLGVEVLEDEHKDNLIKLLQAIAAPGHELRITSGPIGRGGEEVSVGLPVALLADLVLVELSDLDEPTAVAPQAPTAFPPEPEPEPEPEVPEAPVAPVAPAAAAGGGLGLTGFAAAFGPELMAWLVAGGSDDGASSGPEEMVSHLQGFLADEGEAVQAQLDRVSATPGGPVCIILGASLVEGHSILCARLQGDLLLGVVEGDSTRAALAAWRAVLA